MFSADLGDSGPLKGWCHSFSISGGDGSRFPAIAIFSCLSPESHQSGRTILPNSPCSFKGMPTQFSIRCSGARGRRGPFWPLPSEAAEPVLAARAVARPPPRLLGSARPLGVGPAPPPQTSRHRCLVPPIVSTETGTLSGAHLSMTLSEVMSPGAARPASVDFHGSWNDCQLSGLVCPRLAKS